MATPDGGPDYNPTRDIGAHTAYRVDADIGNGTYRVRSLAWEPGCDCGAEPVPCRVLDPYSGTGSTGVATIRNGRHYTGIELSEEYQDIARRRLAGTQAPLPHHWEDAPEVEAEPEPDAQLTLWGDA